MGFGDLKNCKMGFMTVFANLNRKLEFEPNLYVQDPLNQQIQKLPQNITIIHEKCRKYRYRPYWIFKALWRPLWLLD